MPRNNHREMALRDLWTFVTRYAKYEDLADEVHGVSEILMFSTEKFFSGDDDQGGQECRNNRFRLGQDE